MSVGGVSDPIADELPSEDAVVSCDWSNSTRISSMGGVLYDIVSVTIDQSGGSGEGSGSVLYTTGSWRVLT